MESEADAMMISTDKWHLSEQERQSLRAANARLVMEKGDLMNRLNRWQGIIGAVRGNVAKAEKEIQEYIKNML
jgi:hypothetical protein